MDTANVFFENLFLLLSETMKKLKYFFTWNDIGFSFQFFKTNFKIEYRTTDYNVA